MKIRSPLPRKRTRLEIIPLIDIMFFLLASFMMVSLQMQKVRALRASLPTATLATSSAKPDIINLNVDRDGQLRLEDQPLPLAALFSTLTNRCHLNPNVPVYVHGDRQATHGSIIYALDLVKRAGLRRVAIAVDNTDKTP
jgi:biopolymer transport protein ExbD